MQKSLHSAGRGEEGAVQKMGSWGRGEGADDFPKISQILGPCVHSLCVWGVFSKCRLSASFSHVNGPLVSVQLCRGSRKLLQSRRVFCSLFRRTRESPRDGKLLPSQIAGMSSKPLSSHLIFFQGPYKINTPTIRKVPHFSGSCSEAALFPSSLSSHALRVTFTITQVTAAERCPTVQRISCRLL